MTQTYDDPQPNIPLLRKGLEWVEEQAKLPRIDSQWEQRDWISFPWIRAQLLVMGETHYANMGDVRGCAELVVPHCGTAYCFAGYIGQLLDNRYATTVVVNDLDVEDFARVELGLTQDQADLLFDGSNTVEDLRRICEEIAGEPL